MKLGQTINLMLHFLSAKKYRNVTLQNQPLKHVFTRATQICPAIFMPNPMIFSSSKPNKKYSLT